MNNNTRNIVKVSALSVALTACVTMSTVCVISTLNYQNTHDSDTSQSTRQDAQGDQHSETDIVPSADLNQCTDAAAINCVHLPDDQSHAYYVNVGGYRWTYEGDMPADNAGEYLGGGWYQTFNRYQAVNATGDSIALGDKFSADMGN